MLEWLSEANTIVYAVSSLVVVQELGSGAQKHLIGHTAPVVALSAAQTNKFVASAQEGALAVVRIWDRVAALPLAILHHHHSDMQQARDAPPFTPLPSPSAVCQKIQFDKVTFARNNARLV